MNNIGVCLFGGIEKFLQSVGQNQIVTVDEANVFADRVFHAGVARGSESQIFFVAHELDFGVVAVKFLAKRNAAVRRRVVNQNDFKVLKRLRQNAVDAKLYVLLDFVDGHDNRNKRIAFHNVTPESIDFSDQLERVTYDG